MKQMDDYVKYIFNGLCPYDDKPCPEKISCFKCKTNEREKALMEKMDEMEMLEMLQEELKRLER